jgi:hypothetical protein
MEGILLLCLVIISVIVRRGNSYGGKLNVVVVIISVLLEQKFHMEGRLLLFVVIISVIVGTESSYGGNVIIVGGDNIGHCENRSFICREGHYGWR